MAPFIFDINLTIRLHILILHFELFTVSLDGFVSANLHSFNTLVKFEVTAESMEPTAVTVCIMWLKMES